MEKKTTTTTSKSSKKRKIEPIEKKVTPVKEEFGLLVLYLNGDDDYGASDAESYGTDRIVEKVLNGDNFDEYSFNVEPELVLFESEKDRSKAITLVYRAISYVADYDSRKHTDTHFEALTAKQLARYRRYYNS